MGGDVAEVGSGPGSYDIRKSVWHVNVSIDPVSEPNLADECSAATLNSMAAGVGAFLTPCSAGQTRLPMVPSYRTTCIGSL